MPQSELMTPAKLAAYLGLDEGTLQNWRVARKGPRWVKLGNGRNSRVAYRVADVEAWISQMTQPQLGNRGRR